MKKKTKKNPKKTLRIWIGVLLALGLIQIVLLVGQFGSEDYEYERDLPEVEEQPDQLTNQTWADTFSNQMVDIMSWTMWIVMAAIALGMIIPIWRRLRGTGLV